MLAGAIFNFIDVNTLRYLAGLYGVVMIFDAVGGRRIELDN